MQKLFPPLSPDLRAALAGLPRALEAVQPLNSAHRRDLPLAIEELSSRLTSERGVAALPYWSAPRLTAAYLWYFLPWNIIRLARLFSGLALPPPTPLPVEQGGAPLPRILADMGSGPLSLPLALWLARPQWRDMPLTVLCMDAAPHPLELGRRLFVQLAGENSPWRIVTRRAPVDSLLREVSRLRGVPWLMAGANVLNELKARPGQHAGQRLEDLLAQLAPLLAAPGASALLVEPGTRLGGKTMSSLRELALEADFVPVQPCPQRGECPMQGGRSWCHFTFDVQGAPGWLTELSRAAHLNKEALSLAFLQVQRAGEQPTPAAAQARIISAPFSVPGVPGMARYACTERGLALLGRAGGLESGALVEVAWPAAPQEPRQDRKSGAWILEHRENVADTMPARPGRSAAPAAPSAPTGTPGAEAATARKPAVTAPPRKGKKPVKPSKKHAVKEYYGKKSG